MMKKSKIIIISVTAVVVVAALVSAGLYFYGKTHPTKGGASSVTNAYDPTQPSKESADPTKQEAQTTPDLSQDFGACNVVTTSQISVALKSQKGIDVQAANNRGVGHLPSGDNQQACVYSLATTDTGSDRLTVLVTKFGTKATQSQTLSAYSSYPKVSGVGDSAYFVSTTVNPADPNDPTIPSNNYDLAIFSGSKQIDLSLTIPTANNTFTDTTAQAALTSLAQKATLN